MQLVTYQALISNPDNLRRVRIARSSIERLGGDVRIEAPKSNGLVLVTLRLPPGYSPEDVLPGIPFYVI